MSDNSKALPLTLKIITPKGLIPDILCDSIILTVCDNEKGKGGGSYGIKKGHANAIIATDSGRILAKAGDNVLFSEIFGEGFAVIDNNTVTVTANTKN